MKDEFKYEIWDMPRYIAEIESSAANLTEKELENVSGGIMNKKLTASVLAGLSILTSAPKMAGTTVGALESTSVSQKEIKNPNVNSEITKEQAIEDINYVLKVIKDNHVSSVEKIPDEVTNQAKIEIESLKDKVSVIDEWRIISRILAKLHDAHTSVVRPKFLLHKRLPFNTEYEYGKFTCTGGDFKGCEITAINDISIQDLYKIFQNHYSYEVEEWTEHNFFETPSDFIPEWKLSLCGIDTSKPIKVSFNTKSGIQSQNFELAKIETANENSEPWTSYEIDEKNSLGIFKLNECRINAEYTKLVSEFFEDVKANDIKDVVLDLRKNYGGTTDVIPYFATYLKNIDKIKIGGLETREKDQILQMKRHTAEISEISEAAVKLRETIPLFGGNVYILTSHGTFSSAMDFATMFSDNNWGKLIGEVPGNSPECFASSKGYDFTPHSKLKFRITYRKYYRPDETKDGTRLIPDVQVSAKDALNKVYEIIDDEKNYSHFETEHFDVIYPKDEKEKCEKALNELEKTTIK